MHLGFSLTPFGHHPNAWRRRPELKALGFEALLQQVLLAEQAGFDFVLLSDQLGARPDQTLSSVAVPFEPTLLASALATRAKNIGFLAAASTRQHEPYNLARRFASLDQISHGRTGWAIVGTGGEAGRDLEYANLVSALWDSWEDDAFVYDKTAGRFFSPEKMHVLGHTGANFSARGPLNVNRSPQGKPVLAQVLDAGNVSVAAAVAEVFFVQAKSTSGVAEIVSSLVMGLETAGRQRSDIRIIANVVPFVGSDRVLDADDISGAPLTGSPTDIADALHHWLEAGDVDGFNVVAPTLDAFDAFVADVVPELMRRGLIGNTEAGATLRNRLGLPRPPHPASSLEHAS